MKWQAKKIAEVCEINPRRPSGFGRMDGALTTFVPMPAVAENGEGIIDAEQRPFSVVRRGYTYFEEGDVLFAKITPCMQNGKHAIARGLIDGIGFGSTEFHVLRPRETVLADWVHRFLIQPKVLHDAEAYFTGAVGQQRIPGSYLAQLEIPLPPLDEQRRIVGELDAQMKEVERMRAAVDARIEAARALPSSFLRTVFNSPESQMWPRIPLRNLLIENGQYGLSVKADYSAEGLPMLRMGNILTTGRIDWSDLKNVSLPNQEMSSYLLSRGDILFNRTNSAELVGKTAVFDGVQPAVFASYLVRFRTDSEKADARFVTAYINSEFGRRFIEQHMARAVGQVNISASTMHTMPIPTPPISDQRRIVAQLDEQMAHANVLIRALESEREAIAALPAALLREVFE